MNKHTQHTLGLIGRVVVSLLATSWIVAIADEGRLSSLSVPEGLEVVSAVEPGLTAYPMFMNFDDRGRLFIAESTGKDLSGIEMAAAPECQILRLEDTDGDGVFDTRTVFATKVGFPMGVLWHNDALFVISPPEYLRFEDIDDDGVADTRTVLQIGWKTKHTDGSHGPFLGPDGRLYITQGLHGYEVETKDAGIFKGRPGGVFRSNADGTGLERIAGGGFNNPVEVAFTDYGQMMGTMTYFTLAKYGQRDAIMHWVWGGVYPRNSFTPAGLRGLFRTGPLMPVMSKFARIAPSGILTYQSDGLGESYRGALFSAQFNPHRIQVHQLEPDGSTFKTTDSDFMTSTDSDFYPTDLVEDADGSLLFCDTGAWYVDACPISRVAKPQITGSIYRIRPKRSKTVTDPWGLSLDLDALDAGNLMEHLSDERFRVRERVLETIVARGESMIPSLVRAVTSASDAQSRRQVVWALYRIGGDSVAQSIQKALSDSELEVRVAAIQALGELKDNGSLSALTAKLRSESALERREAATALGRIGNTSVTNALLEAVSGDIDRFEQHAIRYALIEIDDRESLRRALDSDKEWLARESALVVLDQLKDPRVTADRAAAFLRSDEETARQTGLWVAQRHPGWSGQILELVFSFLRDGDAASSAQVTEVLKAYAANPIAQQFVAAKLTDESFEHRELLLDVINDAAPAEMPEPWIEALAFCLEGDDESIRTAALNVVAHRRIKPLSSRLADIADNESHPVSSRLTALSAISNPHAPLKGARLNLVLSHLQTGTEPTLRRSAATVLAHATLEETTKLRFAEAYLPTADALILATAMQAFEGETDPVLGNQIIDSLAQNEDARDLMTTVQLERLLDSFPESVHARASRIKEQLEERDGRLAERFHRIEPASGKGDVGRGRKVFFGEKAVCSSCHAIGDEGGTMGPDLTSIGLVRTGHDLLEAVLFPSSSMVPDFQNYRVETADELLGGIIGRETVETITLHTGATESRTLGRKEILSMEPSPISVMPEGLDAGLSDEELIDLITFLRSLNNEKWLLPETRKPKKRN
ncbi:MAG: HEAT repeat domain-containing protein [Planctomycetes bacterium]|nr:HEAT repeat domain-containing protein [Planctomycetota bacterium]